MRQRLRRIAVVVSVTALACAGLVLGSGPAGAVPTGFIVIHEDGCQLNGIDLATGDLTPIGAFSGEACVADLALSPDGTLYGLRSDDDIVELVRFDTTTGAVTLVGQVGTFDAFVTPDLVGGGLVVDQTGRMFAAIVPTDPAAPTGACQEDDAYCLYQVDPANPANTTFVGQMPDAATGFIVIGALAATCDGAVVTSRTPEENGAAFPEDTTIPDATTPSTPAADALDELSGSAGADPFDLANVDPATAVTTTVGSFNDVVTGFDFDTAGVLWGIGFVVGGPASVFTINRATGAATPTVELEGDPNANALAIPKTCPGIVVEPTFTG